MSRTRWLPGRISVGMRRLAAIACWSVVGLTLGACGSPVPASPPAAASEAATGLDADAVDVVNRLLAGDYAGVRQQFDQRMSDALSLDELTDSTQRVLAELGEVQAVGDPGSVRHDGLLVYFVPVSFESGLAHVRLTYDGDGRIAGLYLLR